MMLKKIPVKRILYEKHIQSEIASYRANMLAESIENA